MHRRVLLSVSSTELEQVNRHARVQTDDQEHALRRSIPFGLVRGGREDTHSVGAEQRAAQHIVLALHQPFNVCHGGHPISSAGPSHESHIFILIGGAPFPLTLCSALTSWRSSTQSGISTGGSSLVSWVMDSFGVSKSQVLSFIPG